MKTLPKDIKEAVSENIPKISASKDEVQSIMKDEIEVIQTGTFLHLMLDTSYRKTDFKIYKNEIYQNDSTYYEDY
jgi:hypothetical protein